MSKSDSVGATPVDLSIAKGEKMDWRRQVRLLSMGPGPGVRKGAGPGSEALGRVSYW